jgi:hypothetical protein
MRPTPVMTCRTCQVAYSLSICRLLRQRRESGGPHRGGSGADQSLPGIFGEQRRDAQEAGSGAVVFEPQSAALRPDRVGPEPTGGGDASIREDEAEGRPVHAVWPGRFAAARFLCRLHGRGNAGGARPVKEWPLHADLFLRSTTSADDCAGTVLQHVSTEDDSGAGQHPRSTD